ncbi:hypothetical protein [Spodoptera cosmioides nucleopolyhedrovirus]|uniref:Uncharacterized protein n=1 Tax=Spodoptera cosmioides nucleopolyhedrovirus TaxID=2605774 RepID=A0A6B7KGS4_9ABAC|nr:hypothetical protein [Spodoptera cosmioides nucleopolyhedrovirus]
MRVKIFLNFNETSDVFREAKLLKFFKTISASTNPIVFSTKLHLSLLVVLFQRKILCSLYFNETSISFEERLCVWDY